jgi:outer membrane protein assembly factor BamE
MPVPPPSRRVRRAAAVVLAGLAAMGLGGCASLQSSENFLGVITPYRIEVVQGNVVTREQAALVQPGMSRAQVRDILGSPLLADIFHGDRWDYVFTIRRQGAAPQRRHVVVTFDGDRLAKIEAPELPAEREFVASIDTAKAPSKLPPLALTEEQLKALPAPAAAAAATTPSAPDAPPRTYPPLEPGP